MTENLNKNILTAKRMLEELKRLEKYNDDMPLNILDEFNSLEFSLMNLIKKTPILVKLGLNEEEVDYYFSNMCNSELKKHIDLDKFNCYCSYRNEVLSKMTHINRVEEYFVDEYDSEHEDIYDLYEYNNNRYVVHENYITGCGRDHFITQVTFDSNKKYELC